LIEYHVLKLVTHSIWYINTLPSCVLDVRQDLNISFFMDPVCETAELKCCKIFHCLQNEAMR